jgi:hypothetical protein
VQKEKLALHYWSKLFLLPRQGQFDSIAFQLNTTLEIIAAGKSCKSPTFLKIWCGNSSGKLLDIQFVSHQRAERIRVSGESSKGLLLSNFNNY